MKHVAAVWVGLPGMTRPEDHTGTVDCWCEPDLVCDVHKVAVQRCGCGDGAEQVWLHIPRAIRAEDVCDSRR